MRRQLSTMMLAGALALSPAAMAQPGAPDNAAFDTHMVAMQDGMNAMHAQMARIQATQDPQERKRLLDEHWASMQSSMETMHGMWGPGMMGCYGPTGQAGDHRMGAGHGMGGPMMNGAMMQGPAAHACLDKLTPEQMRQRQSMSERYLGMQQMMMDHVMWHQHWTTMPGAASKP
jgi:hypothetical protein